MLSAAPGNNPWHQVCSRLFLETDEEATCLDAEEGAHESRIANPVSGKTSVGRPHAAGRLAGTGRGPGSRGSGAAARLLGGSGRAVLNGNRPFLAGVALTVDGIRRRWSSRLLRAARRNGGESSTGSLQRWGRPSGTELGSDWLRQRTRCLRKQGRKGGLGWSPSHHAIASLFWKGGADTCQSMYIRPAGEPRVAAPLRNTWRG